MIANPALDDDIRDSRIKTRAEHLAGVAKARLASGNWIAGALSLLLITSMLVWGLIRESWIRSLQMQTCQGVMTSGLDAEKLKFLQQNCVAK